MKTLFLSLLLFTASLHGASIGFVAATQGSAAAAAGNACDSIDDANLKPYYACESNNDAKGANDLTDFNSPGSAAGKIGNAFDFEASSSQYKTAAHSADLAMGGLGGGSGTSYTMAAWVNVESLDANRVVFAKVAASRGYSLYILTDGRVFFFVNEGAFNVQAPAISVSTWYRIVVRYDVVADTLELIINGVSQNTSTSVTDTLDNGSGSFFLGSDVGPAGYFDGLIDEVVIQKRLWTNDEVTADYNSGAGCRPSTIIP